MFTVLVSLHAGTVEHEHSFCVATCSNETDLCLFGIQFDFSFLLSVVTASDNVSYKLLKLDMVVAVRPQTVQPVQWVTNTSEKEGGGFIITIADVFFVLAVVVLNASRGQFVVR